MANKTLSVTAEEIESAVSAHPGMASAIVSLASGSPKGTYATVAALTSAIPAGNTSIYVVTADGTWRYWNGSAWASGGVYQATGIADLSVDLYKIVGMANVNYFDASAQVAPNVIDNNYMNNGTAYASAAYFVSSKIRLTPNVEYTVHPVWGAAGDGVRGHAFTAANVFVSAVNTETFTMPATADYVRFTVAKAYAWTTAMLVQGSPLPTTYIPYGGELSWLRMTATMTAQAIAAADAKYAQSRWIGKKINFLGDSLFTNYGSVDTTTTVPGLVGTMLKFATVRNYGITGSFVSSGGANPMVTRYVSMDDDADAIVFMGGANDMSTAALGTVSDSTDVTFYGALKILFDGLITKYPGKTIIALMPPDRTSYTRANKEAYYGAIKIVSELYGIPCLDLFHNLGYVASNASQLALLMPDGLHWNEEGKTKGAQKIAGFLSAN